MMRISDRYWSCQTAFSWGSQHSTSTRSAAYRVDRLTETIPMQRVHWDKSGEHLEIDYDYCKGCGVCNRACKLGAITMVKETEV